MTNNQAMTLEYRHDVATAMKRYHDRLRQRWQLSGKPSTCSHFKGYAEYTWAAFVDDLRAASLKLELQRIGAHSINVPVIDNRRG